jgi:hypothetical protein
VVGSLFLLLLLFSLPSSEDFEEIQFEVQSLTEKMSATHLQKIEKTRDAKKLGALILEMEKLISFVGKTDFKL